MSYVKVHLDTTRSQRLKAIAQHCDLNLSELIRSWIDINWEKHAQSHHPRDLHDRAARVINRVKSPKLLLSAEDIESVTLYGDRVVCRLGMGQAVQLKLEEWGE